MRIVNGFQLLTIFAKSSIIAILQGPKYSLLVPLKLFKKMRKYLLTKARKIFKKSSFLYFKQRKYLNL